MQAALTLLEGLNGRLQQRCRSGRETLSVPNLTS
jgi:hypothetical protein